MTDPNGPPRDPGRPGYRIDARDPAAQVHDLFELAASDPASPDAPAGPSVPLGAAPGLESEVPWSVESVLAAGRDQERQDWQDEHRRSGRRRRIANWAGVAAGIAAAAIVVPLLVNSSHTANTAASSSSSSSSSVSSASSESSALSSDESSNSSSSESSGEMSSEMSSQAEAGGTGEAMSSDSAGGRVGNQAPAAAPSRAPGRQGGAASMSSMSSSAGGSTGSPSAGSFSAATPGTSGGSASSDSAASGCPPLSPAALAAVRAKLPAGVSPRPQTLARCGPGLTAAARFPATGPAGASPGNSAGLVLTVGRSAPGACRAQGCQPVAYSSPPGSTRSFPNAYYSACGSGCTRVWVYADGRVATLTATGVPRDPYDLAPVGAAALSIR